MIVAGLEIVAAPERQRVRCVTSASPSAVAGDDRAAGDHAICHSDSSRTTRPSTAERDAVGEAAERDARVEQARRVVRVLGRVRHQRPDLGRQHRRRQDARVERDLRAEVERSARARRLRAACSFIRRLDVTRNWTRGWVRRPVDQRRELAELGDRKMRAAEDHHVELAAVGGRQLSRARRADRATVISIVARGRARPETPRRASALPA